MNALELRAALVAAFPPAPITRAEIFAPDAQWSNYRERQALASFEHRRWTELSAELLEQHEALLAHAGAALFRAVLPAYLALLAERDYRTAMLPFVVAGEILGRDRDVEAMTADQRAIVRTACGWLATRSFARSDQVASASLENLSYDSLAADRSL